MIPLTAHSTFFSATITSDTLATRKTTTGPLLSLISDRARNGEKIRTEIRRPASESENFHTDTESNEPTDIELTDTESETINLPNQPSIMSKPAKPFTFDGTDTSAATITTWIFDIKQYLLITDAPDQKKTPIAASYLGGDAKKWYINAYQNADPLPNVDTMLKAFREFFTSPTTMDEAGTKIEKIRQGTKTSKQYSTEFQLLLSEIPKYELSWARRHFLRGLKPEVRRSIVNDILETDNIDTIITKAHKKEATFLYADSLETPANTSSRYSPGTSDSKYRPRASATPSHDPRPRPQGPTIGQSHREGKATLPKLTPAMRDLLTKNDGCWACRKVNAGHKSWNCPEYPRDEAKVKKETVSIVDGHVVQLLEESESESDSSAYPSIPIISVEATIQDTPIIAGIDCQLDLRRDC